MGFAIDWTETALEDLEDLVRFIAEGDPEPHFELAVRLLTMLGFSAPSQRSVQSCDRDPWASFARSHADQFVYFIGSMETPSALRSYMSGTEHASTLKNWGDKPLKPTRLRRASQLVVH